MISFLIIFSTVIVLELAIALLLKLLPRFGVIGKDIAEACTEVPVLDGLLSVMYGDGYSSWFGHPERHQRKQD